MLICSVDSKTGHRSTCLWIYIRICGTHFCAPSTELTWNKRCETADCSVWWRQKLRGTSLSEPFALSKINLTFIWWQVMWSYVILQALHLLFSFLYLPWFSSSSFFRSASGAERYRRKIAIFFFRICCCCKIFPAVFGSVLFFKIDFRSENQELFGCKVKGCW